MRAALIHMAWIGVALALAFVALNPPYVPVAGWLATVVTLLVVGLLIGLLRDYLRRLIGSLSEATRRDPLTELLNRRAFIAGPLSVTRIICSASSCPDSTISFSAPSTTAIKSNAVSVSETSEIKLNRLTYSVTQPMWCFSVSSVT